MLFLFAKAKVSAEAGKQRLNIFEARLRGSSGDSIESQAKLDRGAHVHECTLVCHGYAWPTGVFGKRANKWLTGGLADSKSVQQQELS